MKTLNAFMLLAIYALPSEHQLIKSENQLLKEGTITNLFDAFGRDSSLTKGWGFSCITRYNGKTILFDAGSHAEIFRANTTRLGVDLSRVDLAIVSHPHFDHLNGMDYLLQVNPKVKIYFPYDVFWGAPFPFDATGTEAGIHQSLPKHMQYFDGGDPRFTITQSGRFWNANIEYVHSSQEILPGLKLIFTRSDYLGYFSCYPGNRPDDGCSRTGLPELSLSIKTDRGEVLLVGCSHTGVEKIIGEAKAVTKNKIELVYGGFHMLPFNRKEITDLVSQIKNELQVHRVAPAHCTGHLAFEILQQQYGNDYLFAGLGETINY
jgi:7,8-dihydropterin-6-yl-methyl-4-(beta-D-ribofuranosyl)aminobenzene 5'-phosphate synthase